MDKLWLFTFMEEVGSGWMQVNFLPLVYYILYNVIYGI